ncbi:MAG TPA: type II toxin-antitoxin system PemK/MazF family toxin [Gemmatimonadales bacterium]|nr:type II toxin-antitoxin system PemK/MazF family toxin [Gemmatimonadales bacterium]
MKWTRGEVYLVSPAPGKDPKRSRAVVIVSRQTLCESRADKLICAPVNTQADGRSTEVPVGIAEGLKHTSVINCDQLILVPKSSLSDYRGALSPAKLGELRRALRIALDLE